MAAAATTTPTAHDWPHDLWSLRLSDAAPVTDGGDGFHRSWIMLFREGQFPHSEYGEVDLSRKVLDEIKTNFDAGARGIEIALDEEHDAKKATGWIEHLQYRPAVGGQQPAGLWAEVRWTPYGLQMLKEQIYRYISPEFRRDWTNPITGKRYHNVLVGGALTNRPFLQMDAIQLSARKQEEAGAMARKPATKKRGRKPVDEEIEDQQDGGADEAEEEELAEGDMPDEETYDEADGDGEDMEPDADEEEEPAPAPKKKATARKTPARSTARMSETYSDTVTLREKLREQERQLSELREREQALSLRLYEREVDEKIAAWGDEKYAPSKAFSDAFRGFMLSEGLRLGEDLRGKVTALIEAAFQGAVELSQTATSFDMESRTTKSRDGDKVAETANRLALSDKRNAAQKELGALAAGTNEERALAREFLVRAIKETGADFRRLQLVTD